MYARARSRSKINKRPEIRMEAAKTDHRRRSFSSYYIVRSQGRRRVYPGNRIITTRGINHGAPTFLPWSQECSEGYFTHINNKRIYVRIPLEGA